MRYTKGGKSNMALMEVKSISGHQFGQEDMSELAQENIVQRIDLDKGATLAQIYLDPVIIIINQSYLSVKNVYNGICLVGQQCLVSKCDQSTGLSSVCAEAGRIPPLRLL